MAKLHLDFNDIKNLEDGYDLPERRRKGKTVAKFRNFDDNFDNSNKKNKSKISRSVRNFKESFLNDMGDD